MVRAHASVGSWAQVPGGSHFREEAGKDKQFTLLLRDVPVSVEMVIIFAALYDPFLDWKKSSECVEFCCPRLQTLTAVR